MKLTNNFDNGKGQPTYNLVLSANELSDIMYSVNELQYSKEQRKKMMYFSLKDAFNSYMGVK